jgi:hypothetical protein
MIPFIAPSCRMLVSLQRVLLQAYIHKDIMSIKVEWREIFIAIALTTLIQLVIDFLLLLFRIIELSGEQMEIRKRKLKFGSEIKKWQKVFSCISSSNLVMSQGSTESVKVLFLNHKKNCIAAQLELEWLKKFFCGFSLSVNYLINMSMMEQGFLDHIDLKANFLMLLMFVMMQML